MKTKIILAFALSTLSALAANPSFNSFETNWFNTNDLRITIQTNAFALMDTNIAAYQAKIATNDLNTVLRAKLVPVSAFNNNQFASSGALTNIKSDAMLTNLNIFIDDGETMEITATGSGLININGDTSNITINDGVITATAFSGVGSALTTLNASSISFGTLNAARLPAFAGGDVTSSAGSAVLTIANDAVTYAKLQNVSATSRVLGRKTALAGNAEELTFSEVLDFVGSAAQGDILYRNATAWVRLPAGTSGQYLKTAGAGANPSWAAPGIAAYNTSQFSTNQTGNQLDIIATAQTTNLYAWADVGKPALIARGITGINTNIAEVYNTDGTRDLTVEANGALTVSNYGTFTGMLNLRNGLTVTSNTFPITSFAQLPSGCSAFVWMSNATVYLIATNSINTTAYTNKLGGL